ncbi:probable serine/threonine-protein kinase PBL10 [Solanum stenotomum]|uniref:probable serine/threonine-protein kinase PBL10 n=1 Tax=Solanum stenotomum TaxID=172797 RepID=UPI0020D04E74|nr:probable serine/threonine-protein kinase PBL10 [Solanum stenotomum]
MVLLTVNYKGKYCSQSPQFFSARYKLAITTVFVLELLAITIVFLITSTTVLGWRNIVRGLTGAALGLQHLHQQELICRNFKTENILVDEDFNGVLTDFGSVGPEIQGIGQFTPGYIDLHSFTTGLTQKHHDIYSLGIVLLQVITQSDSVTNTNGSNLTIRPWLSKNKRTVRAVDKRLTVRLTSGDYCKKEDNLAITKLAMRCVHDEIDKRPDINEVVRELQKLNMDTGSTS